jgi:hypothetical protein
VLCTFEMEDTIAISSPIFLDGLIVRKEPEVHSSIFKAPKPLHVLDVQIETCTLELLVVKLHRFSETLSTIQPAPESLRKVATPFGSWTSWLGSEEPTSYFRVSILTNSFLLCRT